MLLIIETITFSFAWWLGLFLLQKMSSRSAVGWTAGGLVTYALSLCLNSLGQYADGNLATLLQLQVPLLLAPLLFWGAALWQLRVDILNFRWAGGEKKNRAKRRSFGLILIASIAFALGLGLIFLPFSSIPRSWMILGISVDLLVLGYAVGFLDAFDQGERFLPEFLRALFEAETVALLFGLQVGFVIFRVTGPTLPMVTLLYFILATAILIHAFYTPIQYLLDRLVFNRFPALRRERATLRELTDALPRAQRGVTQWSEEEFVKLTRKALSQISNMPKLAANPLIYMPIIEGKISAQRLENNSLARATELKSILIDSIEQLKPTPTDHFGTSKGWRHYNALYFPYVRGLKPYGRTPMTEGLTDTEREALDWFVREVPTRTLFNWQSAAAKVVAQDLLEKNNRPNGKSA